MGTIGNVDKISEEFQWRIPNFFSLAESDKPENSPTFSFAGELWYMSISLTSFPGFITVWLSRYCSGPSIELQYTLSLRTSGGKKHNLVHYTHSFSGKREEQSFMNYTSRTELLKRQWELVPRKVLTVLCTIKHTTSTEDKGKNCFS